MKTLALTALAVLILSNSALAIEKHSAVAPEPAQQQLTQSPMPDVGNLPDSLKRAVFWAYFLGSINGNLTAIDLSRGVRFVNAQMDRYAE